MRAIGFIWLSAARLQGELRARPFLTVMTVAFTLFVLVGCGGGEGGDNEGDAIFQNEMRFNIDGNLSLRAVADLNSDGQPDLLVGRSTVSKDDPYNVSLDTLVLLGNGAGAFQQIVLPVFFPNIKTVDINGDGHSDLVTVGRMWLGNGDGTFQDGQYFDVGVHNTISIKDFVVADFNVDGQADLLAVFISQENGTRFDYNLVLLGNSDGTFQSPQRFDVNNEGIESVAVGDFNGDGQADLLAVRRFDWGVVDENGNIGNVLVLLGNGDGTFQNEQHFGVVGHVGGDDPRAASFIDSVTVADFNSDGQSDLFIVIAIFIDDHSSHEVSVLLGNGDGTFHSEQRFATGDLYSSVVVADFNGDGHSDLVTAYDSGEILMLLGNGDGTFQTEQNIAEIRGLSSLEVADFNRDGQPDLIAVNGDVRIFLNR